MDALALLAEAALGKGLGRTERGEPYQIMVHLDADGLAERSHGGRAELDNGVDCFWDVERMDCDFAVSALMTYDDDPIDKQ